MYCCLDGYLEKIIKIHIVTALIRMVLTKEKYPVSYRNKYNSFIK